MKHAVLFILSSLFSSVVVAKTWPVCPTCTHTSVAKTIERAAPFDTVLVKKGTYAEFNIKIKKPLTLLGQGYPVIDGQKKGEIITVYSDSVTIDGLFIKNVGTSYTADYAAIRLVKCNYFAIQNVVLEKLFFGIYLEKAEYGRIYNNKIIGDAKDEYNSGNGIHFWYAHHIVVSHNIVQRTRDGIYLEFSDFVEIKNNQSRENLRYGLHFMFSNNDVYTKNTFEKNGAGVAVMFSKNIKMTDNRFINNWGPTAFGLLLKEITDAEIKGNLFEQNTIGISIEGSSRINYTGNTLKQNGWAVRVLGACYSNRFAKNNFIHNSFDVAYNSQLHDNEFAGNYWSNYTGYDLNRDGIGDVPYRPVKLFSYIVNKTPETIILLRSLFMDIIDFSEKVSPAFTPDKLIDAKPLMKPAP